MTRAHRAAALAAVCALSAVGCDDSPTRSAEPRPSYEYSVADAFPDVRFKWATDLRHAGDDSGRFFVTERLGRVMVFDPVEEPPVARVFLDITDRVEAGGLEMGLLGLVFHPSFASNGYFFVYYTTGAEGARSSRLSRFRVTGDPDVADPASEDVVLEIAQPSDIHNGGGLAFDGQGYLLLALGDGGDQGDSNDNAQDRATLHGSILRLLVRTSTDPPFYWIPPDNPLLDNPNGWREEIYAWGFRNPWRLGVDPATGDVWVGDVGQDAWEEVDRVVRGGNYGWDCREGAADYTGPPDGPSPECAGAADLVEPVFAYPHADDNRSVTGGNVYRGPTATSLNGRYVFADFVSGRIWAMRGADAEFLVRAPFNVSTFALGPDDELYLLEYNSVAGGVYRIEQAEVED